MKKALHTSLETSLTCLIWATGHLKKSQCLDSCISFCDTIADGISLQQIVHQLDCTFMHAVCVTRQPSLWWESDDRGGVNRVDYAGFIWAWRRFAHFVTFWATPCSYALQDLPGGMCGSPSLLLSKVYKMNDLQHFVLLIGLEMDLWLEWSELDSEIFRLCTWTFGQALLLKWLALVHTVSPRSLIFCSHSQLCDWKCDGGLSVTYKLHRPSQ